MPRVHPIRSPLRGAFQSRPSTCKSACAKGLAACAYNLGAVRKVAPAASASLRGMTPHVLMVDDNPGDLQLIEEAFKDSRLDVAFIAAMEAQSALEYLARAAVGQEQR